MKNKILNYTRETVGNLSVSDYFSKKIDVYSLFYDTEINMNDFVSISTLADDDKLERITFELYGSTDYWDLILMLNDRNPLFDMPYNFDNVTQSVEEYVRYYSNIIYYSSPLNEIRTQELIEEWKIKALEKNEKLRFIYVILPSKMPEFIRILREKDYL